MKTLEMYSHKKKLLMILLFLPQNVHIGNVNAKTEQKNQVRLCSSFAFGKFFTLVIYKLINKCRFPNVNPHLLSKASKTIIWVTNSWIMYLQMELQTIMPMTKALYLSKWILEMI